MFFTIYNNRNFYVFYYLCLQFIIKKNDKRSFFSQNIRWI